MSSRYAFDLFGQPYIRLSNAWRVCKVPATEDCGKLQGVLA